MVTCKLTPYTGTQCNVSTPYCTTYRLVKKSASDVSNGGGEVSNSNSEEVSNSEDDDDVDCPVCHVRGLSCQWICCDDCNVWYHMHCTDADPGDLPDMFH